MNVQVTSKPLPVAANQSKLATADCDIHPQRNNDKALHPYLEQRWIEHMQLFGSRPRQAYQAGPAYPRGSPTRLGGMRGRKADVPGARCRSCASNCSTPTTPCSVF